MPSTKPDKRDLELKKRYQKGGVKDLETYINKVSNSDFNTLFNDIIPRLRSNYKDFSENITFYYTNFSLICRLYVENSDYVEAVKLTNSFSNNESLSKTESENILNEDYRDIIDSIILSSKLSKKTIADNLGSETLKNTNKWIYKYLNKQFSEDETKRLRISLMTLGGNNFSNLKTAVKANNLVSKVSNNVLAKSFANVFKISKLRLFLFANPIVFITSEIVSLIINEVIESLFGELEEEKVLNKVLIDFQEKEKSNRYFEKTGWDLTLSFCVPLLDFLHDELKNNYNNDVFIEENQAAYRKIISEQANIIYNYSNALFTIEDDKRTFSSSFADNFGDILDEDKRKWKISKFRKEEINNKVFDYFYKLKEINTKLDEEDELKEVKELNIKYINFFKKGFQNAIILDLLKKIERDNNPPLMSYVFQYETNSKLFIEDGIFEKLQVYNHSGFYKKIIEYYLNFYEIDHITDFLNINNSKYEGVNNNFISKFSSPIVYNDIYEYKSFSLNFDFFKFEIRIYEEIEKSEYSMVNVSIFLFSSYLSFQKILNYLNYSGLPSMFAIDFIELIKAVERSPNSYQNNTTLYNDTIIDINRDYQIGELKYSGKEMIIDIFMKLYPQEHFLKNGYNLLKIKSLSLFRKDLDDKSDKEKIIVNNINPEINLIENNNSIPKTPSLKTDNTNYVLPNNNLKHLLFSEKQILEETLNSLDYNKYDIRLETKYNISLTESSTFEINITIVDKNKCLIMRLYDVLIDF